MIEDPHWPRASTLLKPYSDRDSVREGSVAWIGCPLSKTSISPSQAHETPEAVRQALARFSSYGVGLGDAGGQDCDLSDLEMWDHGDLSLHELDGETAQARLQERVQEIVDSQKPSLTLLVGGDNAITRGGMKATVSSLDRAGLLTFDAHHDVREYYAGPSNGTPVRGLLDDGLPGENVAQIGIGTFTNSKFYREFCDRQGIRAYDVSEVRRRGMAEVVRESLDDLASRCDQLFVDFDIDVLDRAFVPGCPGARPGGLLPHELHEAAYHVGQCRSVVAADFTEVDAIADVNGVTVQNTVLTLLHVLAGFRQRS